MEGKKICRCKRIRPIYLRKRGSFGFGNERSRAAFFWPEFRKIAEHSPCLAILKWESIKSKIPSNRARTQPVKLSSLRTHHKHHRPALITPRASRCITLLWKHGLGEWSLKLSERDPPALSDQSGTESPHGRRDERRRVRRWVESSDDDSSGHGHDSSNFQSRDPFYVFVFNVRPKGLNYTTITHPESCSQNCSHYSLFSFSS